MSEKIKVVHIKENDQGIYNDELNIHYDDNITSIKHKLIENIPSLVNTQIDEIYLFGKIKTSIDPEQLFNRFTQNKGMFNVNQTDIDILFNNLGKSKKKIRKYNFKQFNKLYNWKNITQEITIGHNLFDRKLYPYTVNPYKLITQDDKAVFDQYLYSQKNNKNIIIDEESHLLLEYGKLVDDTIYVCYAKDFIDAIYTRPKIERADDFFRYILQIYFPKLHYNKKITTKNDLLENKITISEKNNKEKIAKYNANINRFYKNIISKHTGYINHINFVIHPFSSIYIPLDLIFKILHSKNDMPLIKYNPGKKIDKIFRLYTGEYVSEANIKLPKLYVENNSRLFKINNIDKVLSNKKSIGFYITERDIEIYGEFYENGNINIQIQNSKLQLKNIEQIIKEKINNLVIVNINNFIKKSGFTYPIFNTLRDNNVELIDLNYTFSFQGIKSDKFKLSDWASAISNIFITNNKTLAKGDIEFTYKRVGSYKKMDAIQKFITEQKKLNLDDSVTDQEIRDLLIKNFDLTKAKAVEEISQYNKDMALNTEVYSNKKIEIKNNPGFDVKISRNFNNTNIEYKNINNILYLQHIDIYTNNLIENFLVKTKKEIKAYLKKEFPGKIKIVNIPVSTNEQLQVQVEQDKKQDDILKGNIDGKPIEEIDDTDSVIDDDDDDIYGEDTNTGSVDYDSDEFDDDGDGSDLDDDLDDDEDLDDELMGGASSDSDSDSDDEDDEVVGSLSNIQIKGRNNYFIQRIRDKEPEIASKKGVGKSNSFARSCPSSAGKVPVLLTNEDKEKIDNIDKQEGIKSYDEYITSKAGYHYICPRFWCFSDKKAKSGRSLSLQQVNNGECGGWDAVIPWDNKQSQIPKGKRIYEFSDKTYHNGIVNNRLIYKTHYPSFQYSEKKTKDGKSLSTCVPCCFTQPSSDGNIIGTDKSTGELLSAELSNDGKNLKMPLGYGKDKNNKYPDPSKYSNNHKNFRIKELSNFVRKRPDPSKQRKKIEEECSIQTKQTEKKEKKIEITNLSINVPIVESFPLGLGKLGYLPLVVQKFFNYNIIQECWINSKNQALRSNKFCLLRIGVERGLKNNASLLGCIGNIISKKEIKMDENWKKLSPAEKRNRVFGNMGNNIEEIVLTIRKHFGLKYKIINNEEEEYLSPDKENIKNFVALNKGNLFHMFYDYNIKQDDYPDTFSKNDDEQTKKIKKAIINFDKFLLNGLYNGFNQPLSHDILWDLITAPKKYGGCFFDKGCNLLILKKSNDDPTNKLEVVCPKNNFSKHIFNKNKETIMLYSDKNSYEPIFMIKRPKEGKNTKTRITDWQIKKLYKKEDFSHKDFKLTSFNQIIKELTKKMEDMCNVKKGWTNYDFIENKTINKLLDSSSSGDSYLKPYKINNYLVKKLLYNDNMQVIAAVLSVNNLFFALPCAPSSLIKLQGVKNELYGENLNEYLNSYEETVSLLKLFQNTGITIYNKINKQEVKDNTGVTIGLLTNTNQVILVKPDVLNEENRSDEYELDKKIMLNYPGSDEERKKIIKKIKLESNFYLMFRNLFKVLINKKENEEKKMELINIIEEDINEIIIDYYDKKENIISKIIEIMKDEVEWFDIDENVNPIDLLECLDLSEGKCNNNYPQCSFKDNKCKINFPLKNLIYDDVNVENNVIYYEKLTDEIIRYDKIREYVFKNETFFNFENIDYKINDDEIIILKKLMEDVYTSKISGVTKDKLIKNRSLYENVNSKEKLSKKYINKYKSKTIINNFSDDIVEEEKEEETKTKKTKKIRKNMLPQFMVMLFIYIKKKYSDLSLSDLFDDPVYKKLYNLINRKRNKENYPYKGTDPYTRQIWNNEGIYENGILPGIFKDFVKENSKNQVFKQKAILRMVTGLTLNYSSDTTESLVKQFKLFITDNQKYNNFLIENNIKLD